MEKENVDNWKRKPNIITVYTLRNVTWTWYWILYISSLILPELDIEYCIYQGILPELDIEYCIYQEILPELHIG